MAFKTGALLRVKDGGSNAEILGSLGPEGQIWTALGKLGYIGALYISNSILDLSYLSQYDQIKNHDLSPQSWFFVMFPSLIREAHLGLIYLSYPYVWFPLLLYILLRMAITGMEILEMNFDLIGAH